MAMTITFMCILSVTIGILVIGAMLLMFGIDRFRLTEEDAEDAEATKSDWSRPYEMEKN